MASTATLGIEVRAAAHFEAILQQWCGHCFEELNLTEAGMVAIHLQEVATLSVALAREAASRSKDSFMVPCPMYEQEGLASAEDLCKALRKEVRRLGPRRSQDKPSSDLNLPEGVQTFAMMDSDDELSPSSATATQAECSRLQEELEAADRRVVELLEAERLLRDELHRTHRTVAELADEKCRLTDRLNARTRELQEQIDTFCEAGDGLCPACDRRFSMANADEEVEVADATTGQAAAPEPKDHSIVAVVRLKPHPPQGVPVWTSLDSSNDTVVDGRTGQDMSFDRVFGPEESTEHLFETCAEELVQSFCQGINATIMAYGQTASGKTFTMEGSRNSNGMIQLSVEAIFSYFADLSRTGTTYTMRAAYLEIHNEKLIDLLADGGPTEVRLLETSSGKVQTAPAHAHFDIYEPSDVQRCMEAGARHRHVGQTRANDQSSRSHTVLQLQLESRLPSDNKNVMRRSLLNLVDLAGSESVKHTGAAGDRLTEGRNINRSLLALSQVVSSLADTNRMTPRPSFRDSKLTRIIQQSIGGNSRTALICTVSTADWHYHESKRSLEFALRAKSIKNQVSANIVKLSSQPRSAKESQECRKLQNQNENLQSQNEKLQMQLGQLRAQLAPPSQENSQEQLRAQLAQYKLEGHVQKKPQAQSLRPPLSDATNLQGRSNLPEKRPMRRKNSM